MLLNHFPSVYTAEAPLHELQTVELLLTTTLRLFASPYRDPDAAHPDWRSGLRAAEVAECGVPAFNGVFNIVPATALHPLDVRCPHCRFLGKDEGRLLELVSLLQRERVRAAAAILAGWAPPAAARMAMLPAQGLANALARGGLIVPERHAEAAMPHRTPTAIAGRGLALVAMSSAMKRMARTGARRPCHRADSHDIADLQSIMQLIKVLLEEVTAAASLGHRALIPNALLNLAAEHMLAEEAPGSVAAILHQLVNGGAILLSLGEVNFPRCRGGDQVIAGWVA